MGKLLACIFVLTSLWAWSQPSYLSHKPYAAKYHYLDSFYQDISIFSDEDQLGRIHQLLNTVKQTEDYELNCELLLKELRANHKEYLTGNTEDKMLEIITGADQKKDYYIEADALQALGVYWADQRKFGLAFENFLSAYTLYSKFTPEEFPPKQKYLFDLAGTYFHFDDSENAMYYLREALHTRATYSYDLTKTINNTIGLQYRKMGKYDSAEYFFRQVLQLGTLANDTGWIGISLGNIGITYFLEKRYAEAIPLLTKDINTGLGTNNIRNAARSMTVLAQIYYINKDYDKSEELLKKSLSIMECKSFWPEYPLAEPIFRLLSKVYAAKNDANKGYVYADFALMAKDSVEAQNNVLFFAKVREKAEVMQHKLEKEQLLNQKKMQVLIRNGLALLILLLTIIAILFINRQRLKQKKLEAEKKNTETELNNAALLLDSFRLSMQEKNNLIEQFTNELEKLKSGAPEQETSADVLTQLQHAIILTDEQWENFRLLFEKVHRNFFVNLKGKFPGLSQAEVRFLALTKLKLSSKEMASMLGISPNTIRIYRHRLRRKLELDKEDMIEQLVDNL